MHPRLAGLLALLPAALLPALACAPEAATGPLLTLSPDRLDFGVVPVDGSSTLPMVLSNDGSTAIDLLSVTLEADAPGDWGVEWPGATTLAPGDAVTVQVRFAPEAEGDSLGELVVRSDLDDPQREVALSGTGGPSEVDADGDGYSPATGDCDDGRAEVHPGAEELCDGLDNDCAGGPEAAEVDGDGDGWLVCEGDCDDQQPAVHPDAEEVCDGVDTDCDGDVPDDRDDDGDGYTLCDGDCDDAQPLAWPGAEEVCDYVDNDCSGGVDDLDADGDGFSACASGGDCDDADPGARPVLVDAAAGDGGDGGAAAPVQTIEAALGLLDGACDTVLLRAGTYEASITRDGQDLALVGAEADPAAVVLTAPEGARVLDVAGGAAVTLRHLSVTGGAAPEDGGALRATGAALVLEEVLLSGNSSGGDGGAVAVSSGSLTLAGCTFLDNTAGDDGGAVAALTSAVLDEGSLYQGNRGARGGAVVWESSAGTLRQAVFTGNEASFEGGALWLLGGGGIHVEQVDLWENGAAGSGGAVAVTDLADEGSVLRNLWVEGNLAGEDGGGIAVTGTRSALVLANSDVLGNDAGGHGGGIYLGAADAAGTWAWSNIVAWNGGSEGLWAQAGGGASVAYTLSYNSSAGTELTLGPGEDGGENLTADPRFVAYDPGEAPEEHDLSLSSTSPARNAGPRPGEGPTTIADWSDLDGTRNDRGLTGGQGALE